MKSIYELGAHTVLLKLGMNPQLAHILKRTGAGAAVGGSVGAGVGAVNAPEGKALEGAGRGALMGGASGGFLGGASGTFSANRGKQLEKMLAESGASPGMHPEMIQAAKGAPDFMLPAFGGGVGGVQAGMDMEDEEEDARQNRDADNDGQYFEQQLQE